MGTETKINCYTENTATGINRVPNIVKLSSATTFNNCVNNGKCSSTNIVTSVSNSTSAQPLPSSSQIAAGTSVPFVPIHIDENAVIEGAKEILKVIRPTWDLNFVQFKKFTDGITNKLVGCFYNPPSDYHISSITNNLHNTKINESDLSYSDVLSQSSNTNVTAESTADDNNDSGNLSDADADTDPESAMSTNTNMTTTNEAPPTKNVVLVRVYGNKTDLLIDRKAETRNIILLHSYGFAPSLYATFKNGLVYDFVPGVTLNPESVLRPEVWSLVAQRMANMHRLVKPTWNHDVKPVPMLWKKTQSFFDLVPVKFTDANKHKRLEGTFLPITRMRKEFSELYKRLEALGSPLVFTHNDLLLGNVIYTESSQTVTFIDYEYADYNYQAFDIGNHFTEFAGVDTVDYTRYPSRDFQMKWLRVYLQTYLQKSQISDAEVEVLYVQVNQFALAAHFFWVIWCLIQAEHSTIDFDYVEYAFIRYNEYLARKDEFLALDANLPKCKI
ncbi:ethanolamine kinase [Lucilia cuprina]|uniref:ethanolamine kinase n=1 Tax=Lucilia cuprina TaxID=7375 RepID=UPI001F069229|nr:ethanolamine kinase [Lucilia cuprina]